MRADGDAMRSAGVPDAVGESAVVRAEGRIQDVLTVMLHLVQGLHSGEPEPLPQEKAAGVVAHLLRELDHIAAEPGVSGPEPEMAARAARVIGLVEATRGRLRHLGLENTAQPVAAPKTRLKAKWGGSAAIPERRVVAVKSKGGALLPPRPLRPTTFGPNSADYYEDPTMSK